MKSMTLALARSQFLARRAAAPLALASLMAGSVACESVESFVPGAGTPDTEGSYSAEGVWDLSGPFTGGRTVGDAVADTVVQKLLEFVSPPSAVEDEVAEILAERVHAPVKAMIDDAGPADLATDGDLTELLARSLASVQISSTIVLEDDWVPGTVSGTETLTRIVYEHEGEEQEIDLTRLGGGEVKAEWAADEDGAALDVEQHPVELHYGGIIDSMLSDLSPESDVGKLRDQVLETLDCSVVLAAIMGGDAAIEIGVGEFGYTLEPSDLLDTCNGARGSIAERVLGMFTVGTKVVVGGRVALVDDDGDGVADGMTSTASFGGYLDVLPEPIALRVLVSFSATRQ